MDSADRARGFDEIRVGVIGAGAMGSSHVRTLATAVNGATVTAVADVDLERARAAAREAGAAGVYADGRELIADPEVDAVLIASIPETHEGLILACLDANKPVLCEKPLTPSSEASRRVVEAEASTGRRLVQVGFMRRYDRAYLELKRRVDAGEVGQPLLVHCAHRNADAPIGFAARMAISDSVVHEIDIVRWLLGQEIVAATVVAGRATRYAPADVRDPLLVLLETDGGVLIDVESFVRARYGYDIRCEIVGEEGTLFLAPATETAVAEGFEVRFAQAYRDELQAWVDAVDDGRTVAGAGAWDGYVASAVTDACLKALTSGRREDVLLAAPPTV